MQNSEKITDAQGAPTTRAPIGTRRGLEELRAVLEASEPTNAPSIRRVAISVPQNLPDSIRLRIRLREAGTTAIREFHLIADRNSVAPDSTTGMIPDLESEQGVRALLPNGGTIRLKIRRVNENNSMRSVGELRIRYHNISGYEQVNQIEFVVQ
ncbi:MULTISPECIES: hypothetical protein [unclassified Coleofasciculus]|uniref:hypothetical protein n=1 Tax=unclassified Coleofasciculus TaxID=2692782 RepID=UPI001880438C|nr:MULTISPECIES: hypothetical protein [unclassified Coleofasciculus]MBE9128732.1 hypothetical protein [Coleofasciculus sp. LEGE 07081]MBE9152394.1 hypothetical protein [Coleofasciculus sp. LEGE 07092]